jgi:peptidoglycan/LPS O-acetylase OafA/YrhL
MPKIQAPLYYPALTGIRALASYLVYFHHFNPFPAWSAQWRLTNEGHIGVTVFFVLSGFLITARYSGLTTISGKWAKQYFRNRFARIYPLYFLLTGLTFLVTWLDPSFDGTGAWQKYSPPDKAVVILTNLTLVRGFFTSLLNSGIMQGWTLTVEETFYCLAPFLLVALARSKAQYLVLGATSLVCIALGVALVYYTPMNHYGFFENYRFMGYRTFFGRAFEFVAGAGLAIFVRQPPSQLYAALPGARFTTLGAAWIGACLTILGFLSTAQTYSWTRWYGIGLNNLVLPIGIVCLFYGLLTERTWLSRLLSTAAAQRLGKASYAFYLVHIGIFSIALQRYVTTNMGIHFTVLLLFSLLLYQYVEVPLNKVIKSA